MRADDDSQAAWRSSLAGCAVLGAPDGHLPRGFQIGQGASGARVVGHHRLPVARRLGDPDRPRDGGPQHLLAKCVRTSSATCAASRVRPSYIVSRIVETCSPGLRCALIISMFFSSWPTALQRVVLALDRDEHLGGGDEGVDGEQAEAGRAVDEDVVQPRLPGRPLGEVRLSARCSRVSRATKETSSISAPARSMVAGAQDRPAKSGDGCTTSSSGLPSTRTS